MGGLSLLWKAFSTVSTCIKQGYRASWRSWDARFRPTKSNFSKGTSTKSSCCWTGTGLGNGLAKPSLRVSFPNFRPDSSRSQVACSRISLGPIRFGAFAFQATSEHLYPRSSGPFKGGHETIHRREAWLSPDMTVVLPTCVLASLGALATAINPVETLRRGRTSRWRHRSRKNPCLPSKWGIRVPVQKLKSANLPHPVRPGALELPLPTHRKPRSQ